MAFQFRLESVRKLRQNTRNEKRLSLGEAVSGESEIIDRITFLTTQHLQLRKERAAAPLRIDTLLQFDHCEQKILAELQTARKSLEKAQKKVEEKRSELVLADQEVKILDKLEEKQRAMKSKSW